MPNEYSGRQVRRYVRVPGPFEGYQLVPHQAPVLIYDLNRGGGFVNFLHDPPDDPELLLRISLPHDSPITVKARTVYRHQVGVAVQFVDLDADTDARLNRVIQLLRLPRTREGYIH